MQTWIKIIPVEETLETHEYFIGRRGKSCCSFWSRLKSGKTEFTSKPGIALRYSGGPRMVEDFARNSKLNLVAIEVPPDADKLWKRRK